MAKVACCRFQKSLDPFAMFVAEETSKRDFTDIYLITFFGDVNFGNTLAMTVIFFPKLSKFTGNFKNAEKN